MKKINTKTTSLFAVTLAALLVTGCLEEKPKDDDNNDNGDPNTEEPDFYEEKGWQLVFADEFEGTVIDDSKWAFEVNCWGGGNAEQQCYVDDPDNAFVEDGKLHIKAIRGEHTGAVHNPDSAEYDPAVTQTQPFTSARLRSVAPNDYMEGVDPSFAFKNDWKYGRFEIRAKLPSGQGTWPAIWMLPTDWEFGGWAASGEIDIMEAVNLKADRDLSAEDNGETGIIPENRVHGTLHYGRNWPNNVYSGVGYDFGDVTVNPADDFHTYAVEWEEGAIRWFVDDIHVSTQTQEGWYTHYQDENGDWQTSGTTAAPFDKNFHLIMNLAIGGNWAANVNETGVDDAIQSAEMVVDFVRVYQCEDDATGVSCGSKGEEGTYTLEPGTVEPDLPVVVEPGPTGELMVFEETINPAWLAWDCCGGSTPSVVTDADATYGEVVKFDITGDTVVGFSSRAGHGAVNGVPHDASENVTVEFDLKMVAEPTAGATTWKFKIESEGGTTAVEVDLSTSVEGHVPTLDTWQHYTFNMSDLVAAGLDASAVDVLMVFPAWGTGNGASFHIDNVEFVNPTETTGPLTVFEDVLSAKWNAWDCCGGSTPSVVVDSNSSYGNVVKFDINNATVVGFTTRSDHNAVNGIPHNATGNSTLEFDLKLVTQPTAGATTWKLKVESDSAATAVEVDLTTSSEGHAPIVDTWQHYTFSLADLATAGLDVTAIDIVMIFPAWGTGAGASFHVDNVKFND